MLALTAISLSIYILSMVCCYYYHYSHYYYDYYTTHSTTATNTTTMTTTLLPLILPLLLTYRTEGTVKDRVTGVVFKTTKGAPHVILQLVHNSDLITQVSE